MRLVLKASLIVPLMAVLATGCAGNPTGVGGGDDDDSGGGGGGGSDGGGGGGGGGDDDTGGGGGLGPWTGMDDVKPSQDPPFGLAPSKVPQFVALGFDDNGYSGLPGTAGDGGLSFALGLAKGRENADGSPVKLSFYLTATYGKMWISESPTYVKRAWHQALMDGHEIGNHTNTHSHGEQFTAQQWENELQACQDVLTAPFDANEPNTSPDDTKGAGIPAEALVGFRTPFLEYNDATFATVQKLGYRYDCSIEDGWQDDHDGTNYMWPYTLDHGSPGHDVLVEWGQKQPLTSHPGLWELPVHPVIVPPDDKCADYGIPPGLRAKMKAKQDWFDEASGKITGFDYNLWVSFAMTKAEFLATLKYTLDQRLAGNRAPFMLGVHSDYYSSKYTAVPNASVKERQEALEEFVDYARSKQEVRVVSNAQILDWVRNPTPLK